MSLNTPHSDYRFGRFTLQPAERRLFADGKAQSIGPRALDVLIALVERAGQLVDKNELLDRVWPGLVVEENNLHVQVSALRKILGTNAIATVAGRGYRFALPIGAEVASHATHPVDKPPVASMTDKPSIAVLPFVNMSRDEENEYFADGLAEELLNALSKIRGLRVVSRTSAFSFKGTKVDIATAAQKLNVATILEGSVRKAGNRVRIGAQLIHVATDSHLWSETYDRELEDIFSVQDDIAQSVVKELRAALLGVKPDAAATAAVEAEIRDAARGRGENAEAYRLFLKANFHGDRSTPEDSRIAVDSFRAALKLDPNYALAWAGLSASYAHGTAKGFLRIAHDEGVRRARDAAEQALRLAPDLAETHRAMAVIRCIFDWDWEGAEASYARALELAPGNVSAMRNAADLLLARGRNDEAIALRRQAVELDPLNGAIYCFLARTYLVAGRLDEAQTAIRKSLELNPRAGYVHSFHSHICLAQGRLDEALEAAKREILVEFRLLALANAFHAQGRHAESDAALEELIATVPDTCAFQIAEAFAYRGDRNQAFSWLDRAYEQRDGGLSSLRPSLNLRGLYDDPRWLPFLEKVGLAD